MLRQSKRVKASTTGEIPKWFVTYSDVITLLMTFFILLLTFSNNEPEKFEMMKRSLFGDGGSAGDIGIRASALDLDAVVVRMRPPSARLTVRGSETPPMYSELVMASVGAGLESFREENEFATVDSFHIDISLTLFFDDAGQLTHIGQKQLQLLAGQMRRLPIDLTATVDRPEEVEKAIEIAMALTHSFQIPIGRVATSIASSPNEAPRGLRLTLVHRQDGGT
ncbi:MAG: hypothetical protein KDA80_03205 [Planctomycetaceae bacterium]|nr:hypothetical protein [Planctomycetaceae bacterium]